MTTSKRAAEHLQKSIELITGDRNQDYGDAKLNFDHTAAMWSAYLGIQLLGSDVAAMMSQFKQSRHKCGGYKADNGHDAGGYTGLWAALTEFENNNKKK